MMHVPSDEELAAIACAYAIVARRRPGPSRAVSRWALAGRLDGDVQDARIAASARWTLAARLPAPTR